MKLTLAHQILIGSAIGLCALFGLRSLVLGVRDGSPLLLGLAVGSLVAMVGLALYLRSYRQKLAAKR